ncbi:methyl-accepting chemotaxis protein [Psychromonas antarctica]|uniref:methyl-accepting chemotaxis protein n=1 Tax=Psychromonas antarctica TaxID=67573 RepID=UPI001EE9405D|nr:methyl-accepting chemotaxis protein [Psychromonas antarctica]MCG6202213.1 methyl-accepting chemotaxis protein [Psychromonas antarctica]
MFKNLKLSVQLNAAFAAILLLLCLISAFAYNGLNSGYGNFKGYRGLAQESNLAGRLQTESLMANLSVSAYLGTPTQAVLTEYKQNLFNLEDSLAQAKKTIKNSQRAKDISEAIALVDEYKSSFAEIVKLIAHRDLKVKSDLDPAGTAIRELMTSMFDYAHDELLFSAEYNIAKAEEALLLGHFYAVKFLENHSESDYKRAKLELGTNLTDEREALRKVMTSAQGNKFLDQWDQYHETYLNALDEIYSTIIKRNNHINTLNRIGSVFAGKIADVGISVKGEQDLLGEQAQKDAENSVSFVTWVSLISVLIGIVMSWLIAKVIKKPIGGEPREIARITETIATGDLTYDFSDTSNSTGIYLSVSEMAANLKELIRGIANTGDGIASSANQASAVSQQTSKAAIEQKELTTQVATAINEMSYSIQEVVKLASKSSEATQDAKNKAQNGKDIVDETIASIQNLAQRVEQSVATIKSLEKKSIDIGSVVEVIQGISEQTNLLALNAAIEAARAGEQGRGFAVVADEVRNLAQRTQVSTSEIQDMIQVLQLGTSDAVKVMNESQTQAQDTVVKSQMTGEALDSIVETITHINDMNTQVAAAVEEQSVVAEEVNNNITAINESAELTAEGANDTSQASLQLMQLAEKLQKLVGGFKIS